MFFCVLNQCMKWESQYQQGLWNVPSRGNFAWSSFGSLAQWWCQIYGIKKNLEVFSLPFGVPHTVESLTAPLSIDPGTCISKRKSNLHKDIHHFDLNSSGDNSFTVLHGSLIQCLIVFAVKSMYVISSLTLFNFSSLFLLCFSSPWRALQTLLFWVHESIHILGIKSINFSRGWISHTAWLSSATDLQQNSLFIYSSLSDHKVEQLKLLQNSE